MAFSFLGRDFYNALSEKDVERFYGMIAKWLGALSLGIPVFVLRDYYLSLLQVASSSFIDTSMPAQVHHAAAPGSSAPAPTPDPDPDSD